jgi:hypothetical protein
VFIVWGTKIKRRKLARVADFCPICRKARAHILRRIGGAGHVYYISFGQGKLLGHEVECETCHARHEADMRDYAAVSQDPIADVDGLLTETFPNFQEFYAPRLAIEQRIAAGTLQGEDRTDMLREPFFRLDSMLEQNRAEPESSPLGKKVGWATLLVGMAFALAAALHPAKQSELYSNLLAALLVLLGVGIVASLVLLTTRLPWYMKNRLRPQLLRALLPLAPNLPELEETLDFCKQSGLRIGKKIKPSKLWSWLEEARLLAPHQMDEFQR